MIAQQHHSLEYSNNGLVFAIADERSADNPVRGGHIHRSRVFSEPFHSRIKFECGSWKSDDTPNP